MSGTGLNASPVPSTTGSNAQGLRFDGTSMVRAQYNECYDGAQPALYERGLDALACRLHKLPYPIQ
jgi:hypothetical protein